ESDFSQILNICKGKKLLSRLLPVLRPANGLEVVLAIASHLPDLVQEDTDQALPLLFDPLTLIIGGLSFTEMIEVLQELTTNLPGTTGSSLRPVFQNKFSISLLYALLSHGEQLLSLDTRMEPGIGDFKKWTDTIFLVAKELAQVPQSSVAEPLSLPSNLLSLFCRYVDKQMVHNWRTRWSEYDLVCCFGRHT
ncbi:protein PAT1 homolog 2-like, partial [Heptranchias perlo]|uniref:protein PAT1 homolog 2-like n=1 Tax=Heptranchias perlo TaxID=212740 RepID=UPI003559B9F5